MTHHTIEDAAFAALRHAGFRDDRDLLKAIDLKAIKHNEHGNPVIPRGWAHAIREKNPVFFDLAARDRETLKGARESLKQRAWGRAMERLTREDETIKRRLARAA